MKQSDIDFIMSIQDIGTSKFNTQTYKENIKWKSLEVLKEISMSPNAKLILTDGKTPVLINGDDK